MESWKRAPTRPTRPAWRHEAADERATAGQPGALPATPEPLPSTPAAPAPQPPYEMPDRLARAFRLWGESEAKPNVGAPARN